jgi:hypothetical protein
MFVSAGHQPIAAAFVDGANSMDVVGLIAQAENVALSSAEQGVRGTYRMPAGPVSVYGANAADFTHACPTVIWSSTPARRPAWGVSRAVR